MRLMSDGDRISVLTDKWSVVRDLEAFAHITENGFLGFAVEGPAWRVTLERLTTSR